MNGREKSDSAIRAMKPANKAGQPAAEWAEQRAGTKGNTGHPHTHRAQNRASVPPGLDRVRQAARQRKRERFTALLHHVSIDLLRESFYALKRKAAPGVDGQTWKDYEAELEDNLQDLHARVQRGTYRPLPVRRRYIPKPDGRQRPLGIAALEDKIVQRAVVTVLNAIYEEDFVGFSYGFRPRRSQHNALDALAVGISNTPVNWILDADIRSFFDTVCQEWLTRFLEHRIGDKRIIRLVRKWLKAGVLEDGEWSVSEEGTPQGAVATPQTQKITSSLSDRFRFIACNQFLTYGASGNTLAPHGPIYSLRESSTSECRIRSGCNGIRPRRSGRCVDKDIWALTPPSLPLPTGSAGSEAPSRCSRTNNSVHNQDAGIDGHSASQLRTDVRPYDRRDGNTRCASNADKGALAWLIAIGDMI